MKKIDMEQFESSHDRNFILLRKFDLAMELNPKKTFCEIFWEIIPTDNLNKKMKDMEMSKLLDNYIDKSRNGKN